MDIKGKNVLITGASRGIGQQIAIACAKEGCNLILHARKLENLKETIALVLKYETDIETVEAELSDIDQVEKMITDVKEVADIDILYNNAAIMTPWVDDVWSCPTKDWEVTFTTNVTSLVRLCNAFIPGMLERGYGRVINTSSGIENQPELAAYSASKAAVDKYTKDIASKLEGTGVLANMLDPGWLKTDLGGENADNEVDSVIPGALVPAKLEKDEMNGQFIRAQEYRID